MQYRAVLDGRAVTGNTGAPLHGARRNVLVYRARMDVMGRGHRTWAGARVGERLMSLIRTCRQRGLDPLAQMVVLRRASGPLVLSLTPAPP